MNLRFRVLDVYHTVDAKLVLVPAYRSALHAALFVVASYLVTHPPPQNKSSSSSSINKNNVFFQ